MRNREVPFPDQLFNGTKQKEGLEKSFSILKERGMLKEREAKVLELRFGLFGKTKYTLRGVGLIFGVTPERIRQIELHALRKLLHPSIRGIINNANH